jgi:hypothetical protein
LNEVVLVRLSPELDNSRADFAVGYFFLSGFQAIAERVHYLDQLRLFIGKLLRIVRDYNLEEAHRAIEDRAEEAPLIPRIVCSEALL